MLTGLPPFYYKSTASVYDAIRFKNPNFFKFHSEEAVDLLARLLNKNPEQRLGSKYGAEEIKQHPFFADIDWN